LNNAEFINILSEKTNRKPKEIQNIIKHLNSIVAQSLKDGDKVYLSDFGSLVKISRQARKIVNPRDSSKIIDLPSQATVRFNSSGIIKNSGQNPTEPINNTKEKNMDDVPIVVSEKENNSRESIFRPVNVSYIDLTDKKIKKEVLELIPEQMARKYQIAPVDKVGAKLIMAMIDPEDQEAIEFVKKKTGLAIEQNICTLKDLNSVLSQYSLIASEVADIVKDKDAASKKDKKVKEKDGEAESEEVAEGSPASKLVNSIIKKAVREHASDIHIEPNENEVEVRLRIDGVLKKIITIPNDIKNAVASRIKILSDLKIDETRLPQDGRYRTTVDQDEIDLRISILPNVNGEKIVMRILDKSKGLLSLEELGLRGKAFDNLEENIKKSHGMILVTGPTGSGKTTSLYAMIKEIMGEGINIVTLEDPVEYRIKGINQTQVRSDIGFNFANGLRSIVRQDPDVIMIGEIRDYETADMAIHAALTGHVVLSTIHTNDASGTIPRLVDMKIEPFLIASTVNAIVAQRLARKICQNCKEENKLPKDEIEYINKIMTGCKEFEGKKLVFYKGKGCDVCNGKGYKGRIGLFEVLPITNKIKEIVAGKVSSSVINEEAIKEGMINLKQDGILKAIEGLTSIEEVWRVTKD